MCIALEVALCLTVLGFHCAPPCPAYPRAALPRPPSPAAPATELGGAEGCA